MYVIFLLLQTTKQIHYCYRYLKIFFITQENRNNRKCKKNIEQCLVINVHWVHNKDIILNAQEKSLRSFLSRKNIEFLRCIKIKSYLNDEI